MAGRLSHSISKFALESTRFFVPTIGVKKTQSSHKHKYISVLIPTFIPTIETYNLVTSIAQSVPHALIVVVDDCTPINKKNLQILKKITDLTYNNPNIVYLRTPQNQMKAAALNYGLDYLMNLPEKPNVVFTFDDDVKISKSTIPLMVKELFSDENIGAVCSQVRIRNKNKNIITRLQGLEYHNFNITKIADNGFLHGPLVMQGMLTAFRMTALKQIKGYTHGHLIEDYDITARLKAKGWKVKIAHRSFAWTTVPEDLEKLWKQRVRWTSGGLHVIQSFWKKTAIVYQDILGHSLFLGLLALIGLSFIFRGENTNNSLLVFALLSISLLNFIVSFSFSVFTLLHYPNRDKKDIILKLTILPEFIYSNLLSLVLIGSYLFFLYKLIPESALDKASILRHPYRWGLTAFQKAGFSTTWGTRQ
jgi:cellulose synthase/poly-beta-1,6-N-acetylglucosamine synthase-like glycosyltransferase